MDYMTFPWEQVGLLLRRLSLSGGIGNAAAWILFLAIGALPLLAAAVLLRRRRACGADFLTVTPGIRFADGDKGDQVRVMTPADAKIAGSDYIVVGRPITEALDPVIAYQRCVAEFVD